MAQEYKAVAGHDQESSLDAAGIMSPQPQGIGDFYALDTVGTGGTPKLSKRYDVWIWTDVNQVELSTILTYFDSLSVSNPRKAMTARVRTSTGTYANKNVYAVYPIIAPFDWNKFRYPRVSISLAIVGDPS